MIRFKTEEEFINEYGEYWRDKVLYTWGNKMDHLFNKKLSDSFFTLYIKKVECLYFNNWSISKDMITLDKLNPYRNFIFKHLYR